jgi:aminoglycoside phosphotransferase (APT) family kinase protein
LLESLDADLERLSPCLLTSHDAARIRHLVDRWGIEAADMRACLAHGDFDLTHIYRDGGAYTGIIDFGEIRGAGQFYDLGHFHLHDGEVISRPMLAWLLEGYGEVITLPSDVKQQITGWSLLLAIRSLARNNNPQSAYHRYLVGAIPRLLARTMDTA